MAKHYFTTNKFELAKAMFEDRIPLEMKGFGGFGEKTGEVISFDNDDAEFDASFLREQFEDDYEKLSDDDKEFLDDYNSVSYSSASEMFPDLDKSYDLDSGIVVFDTEIGQCTQNFLQWDRCVGELYCYDDQYFEFIDEHEEFQTKEYHIARMKKYMEEHEISIEDLK